jgi:hypothetical protein
MMSSHASKHRAAASRSRGLMMGDSSAVGDTGQPAQASPATDPWAMSRNRTRPTAVLSASFNAPRRALATTWPEASSAASASSSIPPGKWWYSEPLETPLSVSSCARPVALYP